MGPLPILFAQAVEEITYPIRKQDLCICELYGLPSAWT
jgi:hypothetical protein